MLDATSVRFASPWGKASKFRSLICFVIIVGGSNENAVSYATTRRRTTSLRVPLGEKLVATIKTSYPKGPAIIEDGDQADQPPYSDLFAPD